MKKVSILIPCYNSEKFVADTLESCINQTYKNWEVILVDDESNDKSFEIAKKYESDKIKVFRQKNSGACCARNLAFEKSTGDYIVYLDADDIISPNYLERHVAVLDSSETGTISFCVWGKFRNDIKDAVFEKLSICKDYLPAAELLIALWQDGVMLQTTCYMTPRELVTKSGGWDETVLKNQDGEFFSRILVLAKTAKYVSDAKVYYRTGEYTSVSRNISEAAAASILDTLHCYRSTISSYEDSERIRTLLAIKLTSYIYVYGNMYPKLYKLAKQEIKSLNMGYILRDEPDNVIKVCRMIGFDNFMTLRRLLLKR